MKDGNRGPEARRGGELVPGQGQKSARLREEPAKYARRREERGDARRRREEEEDERSGRSAIAKQGRVGRGGFCVL